MRNVGSTVLLAVVALAVGGCGAPARGAASPGRAEARGPASVELVAPNRAAARASRVKVQGRQQADLSGYEVELEQALAPRSTFALASVHERAAGSPDAVLYWVSDRVGSEGLSDSLVRVHADGQPLFEVQGEAQPNLVSDDLVDVEGALVARLSEAQVSKLADAKRSVAFELVAYKERIVLEAGDIGALRAFVTCALHGPVDSLRLRKDEYVPLTAESCRSR